MQRAIITPNNKLTSYFSLLPSDIKNLVHSYYNQSTCTHTQTQQYFDLVVNKKSEKENDSLKPQNYYSLVLTLTHSMQPMCRLWQ